jgi:hypothetical protein
MSSVYTAIQFSVFLVNKPGVLAQVTRCLAENKVNVVALTLVDSQEHGVLRVVATKTELAHDALAKLNLPLTQTEVLCVELSNRPGALAEVAELLGTHHININYAYCTSGAPGGKTTGVFKVADQNKALKLLTAHIAKHKELTVRPSSSRR